MSGTFVELDFGLGQNFSQVIGAIHVLEKQDIHCRKTGPLQWLRPKWLDTETINMCTGSAEDLGIDISGYNEDAWKKGASLNLRPKDAILRWPLSIACGLGIDFDIHPQNEFEPNIFGSLFWRISQRENEQRHQGFVEYPSSIHGSPKHFEQWCQKLEAIIQRSIARSTVHQL